MVTRPIAVPCDGLHPDPQRLRQLPLVTLYLTERCNSRCITCDYWRHGRSDMSLAQVSRLLPSLKRLQTRVALISGGEPLLNPEWAQIAQLLKESGLRLWLLTSGLSLAKHAARASQLFDAITVSLDGANADSYAAIRGLNAFERVCAGIAAAARSGVPVSVRVTLQAANYRQMPACIDVARQLGAQQVSFVAVDVANPHAFGRLDGVLPDLALQPQDLSELEQILCRLERDYVEDFRSGFIAESPARLRRIHQYFSAICGTGAFPPTRCNAPEFSAVIDAKGRVNPCFFIAGPTEGQPQQELAAVLNGGPMLALREDIRAGVRSECATCVCSLWREAGNRTPEDLLLSRRANA
jgi:MoaA/NifB/PqqE/SkfB family radical SAM enzyme